MLKRRCGNNNLELSILGTGCWAFGGGEYWGDQNQKDVDEVVRRSVEFGINYFDTAEVYNKGRSEESLGLAIKGLDRDMLVIGSKVSPSNAYPGVLEDHCEASLKRLGLDYIDLYMIHWPIHPHSIRHFTDDEAIINNPPTIQGAIESLLKLKEQGKIRYFGVSNFSKNRLEEILGATPDIAVNELPYSLLARSIELEILPFCASRGVGVIGYMSLLQGLLADIYRTLSDVPEWQRRSRHFNCKSTEFCRHGEAGFEEETNEALVSIRQIAKEANMTMPEIAVKWVAANEDVTCSLVGARKIAELEANVKAVSEPLPQELNNKLNQATETLMKKMGSGFDLYESVENDRTQ